MGLRRHGPQVVDVRALLCDGGRGRGRGLVAPAQECEGGAGRDCDEDDDPRSDRERLPADPLEEEADAPHQRVAPRRNVVTESMYGPGVSTKLMWPTPGRTARL